MENTTPGGPQGHLILRAPRGNDNPPTAHVFWRKKNGLEQPAFSLYFERSRRDWHLNEPDRVIAEIPFHIIATVIRTAGRIYPNG